MPDARQIRPALEADVPFIREIAEATDLFPSDMLDDMISGYFDGSLRDIWFVSLLDDRPVSFGFCEPERMTEGTWNLLALAVTPDNQSTGIGAAMMRYIEACLQKIGARVLIVETMGTPEYARTRAFYARNGYVEEARIRDFYEAGGDKVVFWKRL